MSKPKVIIFDSPDPKLAYRAAISASSLLGDNGIRPCITNFTDIISENINRFFALPLSREAYDPNECIPEFFGYSPNAINKLFTDLMIEKFGKQYFGRVMARRLHRDQVSKVYLIHENTYPESLLAVANEVGVVNMLIIDITSPTMVYKEDDPIRNLSGGYQSNPVLNAIERKQLPYVPDLKVQQLLIHETVKPFVGLI